jgi:hypothetical protein
MLKSKGTSPKTNPNSKKQKKTVTTKPKLHATPPHTKCRVKLLITRAKSTLATRVIVGNCMKKGKLCKAGQAQPPP